MSASIVEQGVELMLFGMGTVILFLGLLVLATTLMSRMLARYFPEPEPAFKLILSSERVAAISAAILRHRKRHRRDHPQ